MAGASVTLTPFELLPLGAATLAIVLVYVETIKAVGKARKKHKIDPPAMTGHPEFERVVRVQANTVEWICMLLPVLWISAIFVRPWVPAIPALIFAYGRHVYARGFYIGAWGARVALGVFVAGMAQTAIGLSVL
eukprot:NODE_4857_length_744_cov_42.737439_g4834_i0.p1 GENE.NODE_4857_length_744_cov_42.737439_g4834_i0~~NODE_4857_length_744_cov_42.737439_g4834_i0.p1  ORF type:complete len:134 (+),score=30.05 NODE_4857_length_744_cov_42.737439_g4834_i0:303-704(+)